MNWKDPPATENQPGSGDRPGQESQAQGATLRSEPQEGVLGQVRPREIRVDKRQALSAAAGAPPNLEVFTLTLGAETIELLPLKIWSQLDHYKWTVRGKLPAEPAGLEIALDHVRIVGETVALNDPAGCLKLERLFNDWLRFERETLELARRKARMQPTPAAREAAAQPEARALRYRVEVDKRGQVHVHCVQGRDTLASIGLTVAGFISLNQQGLMRKPHRLETGALHDWVELDGELCSFEQGRNDAARLERLLNERYVPEAAAGPGKEVVVFVNAASPTGFDIQFPVMVGGVPDNHRHHLDDHSLNALQDPDHCGLLHKEIIVKLIPPNLVFKQKTPDGGEQYLGWTPENTVNLIDEAGHQKTIQLSQPLNLLRLGAAELTAIFNHPSINRHTKAASAAAARGEPEAKHAPTAGPPPGPARETQLRTAVSSSSSAGETPPVAAVTPPGDAIAPPQSRTVPAGSQAGSGRAAAVSEMPLAGIVGSAAGETQAAMSGRAPEAARPPAGALRPSPNRWLKEVLRRPSHRHDWFACLTYSKMAERFGNSSEGRFGPGACWFISLGEASEIDDPEFKGIFLTEKGSLGFLNRRQMAKFYNGVAFIGTQEWALEGIQVGLVAVGMDSRERLVFVLSDNFRRQFGVPESTLGEALQRLREHGAVLVSVTETLASHEPIEIVWTVPAEQADPNDPQALESVRPAD